MHKFSALSIYLIPFLLNYGLTLECYVCERQENNHGKCTTTIKTCDYGEDVCQTEVSWGSTPYWSLGAPKQYYISKRCSTEDKCARFRSGNMPLCSYIWYQDWKCSDCCKGDRCNYYIISGSSTKSFTLVTAIGAIFIHFLSKYV